MRTPKADRNATYPNPREQTEHPEDATKVLPKGSCTLALCQEVQQKEGKRP